MPLTFRRIGFAWLESGHLQGLLRKTVRAFGGVPTPQSVSQHVRTPDMIQPAETWKE
jgi:hypothetical protein